MQLTFPRSALAWVAALSALLVIVLLSGGSQGEVSPPSAADRPAPATLQVPHIPVPGGEAPEARPRTTVNYTVESAGDHRSDTRYPADSPGSDAESDPAARGLDDPEARTAWQELMEESQEEAFSEDVSEDLGWLAESDAMDLLGAL